MVTLNFIFTIHHPILLVDYDFSQIGEKHHYFDEASTTQLFWEKLQLEYIPLHTTLRNIIIQKNLILDHDVTIN